MIRKKSSQNNVKKNPEKITAAEEHADITTARIVDRQIRVERTTQATEEWVNLELAEEEVSIQRIAKNERIKPGEIPTTRHEGDVLIVPVIEEQVEIIRHHILKEEIHIRKLKKTTPFQENITLRHQEIKITKD